MEDIYKNVVECAETGDWLGLIKNAQRMDVEVKELDDTVIPNIQKQISKIKQSIMGYRSTYQWQWYHAKEQEQKDGFIQSYIDSTLNR